VPGAPLFSIAYGQSSRSPDLLVPLFLPLKNSKTAHLETSVPKSLAVWRSEEYCSRLKDSRTPGKGEITMLKKTFALFLSSMKRSVMVRKFVLPCCFIVGVALSAFGASMIVPAIVEANWPNHISSYCTCCVDYPLCITDWACFNYDPKCETADCCVKWVGQCQTGYACYVYYCCTQCRDGGNIWAC